MALAFQFSLLSLSLTSSFLSLCFSSLSPVSKLFTFPPKRHRLTGNAGAARWPVRAMRLKDLQSLLEDCRPFEEPKVELEQYTTRPHIAACILHTIDNCFEGLSETTVVDLGCGAVRSPSDSLSRFLSLKKQNKTKQKHSKPSKFCVFFLV